MKSRVALTVIILLFAFALSAAHSRQDQLRTLTMGEPVERQLTAGESHKYRLELKNGDFLHAVIEQQGIDVVVTLFGIDGKKLVEVDSPNGTRGAEPLFWIAAVAGEYQLEVRALQNDAAAGRYGVKLLAVRASTEIDKKRIAAQQAFVEARSLNQQRTPETRQKRLEKYLEALAAWREAQEVERELTTLKAVAALYNSLGDAQKTIDYSNQALPLIRAEGDRSAEATALQNIGTAYQALGEKQKALEYFNQALPVRRALGERLSESVTLNSIGVVYELLGDKPKALEYYNQALTITQAIGERRGEFRTLINIGFVYASLGEKQKALDYYTRALPISRAIGDRRGEALTLNNIGLAWDALEEHQKALENYNQALPVWREVGDRHGEATTLNNLGLMQSLLDQRQKALEHYNQALPIWREIGDRNDEATTLNNIAVLLDELGEPQKALQFQNQALLIWKAVGNRQKEATTLHNMGSVCSSLDENQRALEYFNQALSIRRAVGDRAGEASSLTSIGSVYSHLSETQKALDYHNQALTIQKTLNNRRGMAITLNNIGLVYSSVGEKQKALDYYNQSLPIRRAIADRSGEAVTLNNIGLVYYSLGEKRRALEYYNQSLAIRRAVGDRSGEGVVLNNIGLAYASLGEKQKALEYYNQALPIRRAVGDRSGEAATLTGIGSVYASLGEKEKALDYDNQALKIWRAVGDRFGEGATLNNLGLLYKSLGDEQRALDYYNQSLPIRRAIGDRGGESTTLTNLMLLWKHKNPRIAIFYGKQAINTIQQLRSNISGLEKEIQQTYLRSHEDTYRDLADLLITQGRLPEAQQVLGLLKEEEYFEFIRRDGKEASSLAGRADLTAEEAAQEHRYREIAGRLTAIGAEYGRLRNKKDRTAEEEQQLTRLESDLTVANQVFQKFLDELDKTFTGSQAMSEKTFQLRESQGLMETLRELGAGAVALYTVMGDDKYRVILVTPDVQKAYESPIKGAELNRKVLEFREAVQNPQIDPRPLGQELYKVLIGPELAKDLEQTKAQTLMWSLDGVLRYLPVAALHDGQSYLVERYRNVVFTPASQTRLKDPVSTSWRALGFGVSKAHEGFSPLPGVAEELRGIIREEATATNAADGVLTGKVLLDEAFNTNAFQTSLRQRYPLVHIASHFSFKPGNETDSFLLLGDGSHLTLAQIKALPNVFSGVDLLTLSACDTATGGGGGGKEVEGFGVLAQRQGAKAVMATLWPVADESTQLLMREFYRLHESNPQWTKAQASQQAQLELLTGKINISQESKNKRAEIASSVTAILGNQPRFTPDPNAPYAHPYYWAPFILIGNWK